MAAKPNQTHDQMAADDEKHHRMPDCRHRMLQPSQLLADLSGPGLVTPQVVSDYCPSVDDHTMKTTSIELEVTLHCLDCFLTHHCLELKAHLSKALIIYCPPGPIVFCRAATDTGLGSDPGGQVVVGTK